MKETKQTTQKNKRITVIQRALELFADKGFHSTTTAEIAKASGISKGSLFNYFESKEQLLRTIVFDTMKEMAELIAPVKDREVSDDEFFGMIHKTFNWAKEKREFLILYFSIMSQPTVYNMLCVEVWAILDPYLKILESFFQQRDFSDPETEVRYFLAMLDGISINYAMDPQNFPIDKIEEKITNYYKFQLHTMDRQ